MQIKGIPLLSEMDFRVIFSVNLFHLASSKLNKQNFPVYFENFSDFSKFHQIFALSYGKTA